MADVPFDLMRAWFHVTISPSDITVIHNVISINIKIFFKILKLHSNMLESL